MPYPGYVSIGLEDPFDTPPTSTQELVNTNRAIAYASAAGALPWLLECGACPMIDDVIPDGQYGSVISDPAPWYNPRKIDSAGFFGVIGLDLEGADSSTRQASVVTAIRGGGVIGATYEGPREMVLRAIAVADAECSLSYGLRWLNEQFLTSTEVCGGDPLLLFDCCPQDVCDESELRPVGPCWVDTYAELMNGPTLCTPDWWPDTNEDMKRAAPYLRAGATGDWCDWPGVYHELRAWLPPWDCCHELYVVPRFKSFAIARVTGGPEVFRRPEMSVGALAEIEFTITTGDPTGVRHPLLWPDTWVDV